MVPTARTSLNMRSWAFTGTVVVNSPSTETRPPGRASPTAWLSVSAGPPPASPPTPAQHDYTLPEGEAHRVQAVNGYGQRLDQRPQLKVHTFPQGIQCVCGDGHV